MDDDLSIGNFRSNQASRDLGVWSAIGFGQRPAVGHLLVTSDIDVFVCIADPRDSPLTLGARMGSRDICRSVACEMRQRDPGRFIARPQSSCTWLADNGMADKTTVLLNTLGYCDSVTYCNELTLSQVQLITKFCKPSACCIGCGVALSIGWCCVEHEHNLRREFVTSGDCCDGYDGDNCSDVQKCELLEVKMNAIFHDSPADLRITMLASRRSRSTGRVWSFVLADTTAANVSMTILTFVVAVSSTSGDGAILLNTTYSRYPVASHGSCTNGGIADCLRRMLPLPLTM